MAKKTKTSALEIASEYVAALVARDHERMSRLRSKEFALDFVHGDAFEGKLVSAQTFWPAWFAAFPEFDLELTRTIASDEVVVTQWTFTGVNSGPLEPPAFEKPVEPTGRTVRLRGASFYDIKSGLIQRETTYIDLATLMVELGVTL